MFYLRHIDKGLIDIYETSVAGPVRHRMLCYIVKRIMIKRQWETGRFAAESSETDWNGGKLSNDCVLVTNVL